MTIAPDQTTSEGQRDALRRQIDESLQKASAHRDRLKRTDKRFSLSHTILSGLTGLTAGVPAATGILPSGNWRLVCAVAAVGGFGAAIIGVVQKSASDAELVSQASECVAKLRELKVNALSPGFDTTEMSGKYQRILTEYSDVNC